MSCEGTHVLQHVHTALSTLHTAAALSPAVPSERAPQGRQGEVPAGGLTSHGLFTLRLSMPEATCEIRALSVPAWPELAPLGLCGWPLCAPEGQRRVEIAECTTCSYGTPGFRCPHGAAGFLGGHDVSRLPA